MRHAPSTEPRRAARRVVMALLMTSVVAASPVAAAPQVPAANAAVVSTWNQIAVSTVTAAGPSPTNFNYFAFVHLAMYNAVAGITGAYELYRWDAPAPHGASPEAAAAAAAHRILVTYFPAAATALNAHLTTSLGLVPDGGPQDKGIAYGIRAADRIIALRTNDGRNAAVTVPVGTGPGHWQPEPGLFGSAWLGGVTPLAVQSATQFAPGAPPAINSATYLQDFNEVRDWGSKTGSLRGATETQTALFFSDAGIVPMQAALRTYAAAHALDIDDSARMFAAVDTAIADGAITVWNAKLRYMWWRPVTAIRLADTDGNPATATIPGWEPFLTSPPYPDWPSGLCSVVSAAGRVLERLNGDGTLGLTISSGAAGVTRTYGTTAQLYSDAVSARVWSGIHFRSADEASIIIGSSVANYTLDHYFQPTD
jgi:hypothetical protein